MLELVKVKVAIPAKLLIDILKSLPWMENVGRPNKYDIKVMYLGYEEAASQEGLLLDIWEIKLGLMFFDFF